MKTEARCTCPAASTLTGPGRTALDAASALLRAHVHRPEAAQHVVDDLRGLLTEVERKNGWQLAEAAGYAHPHGMQRVLDRSMWQADEVRDEVRALVVGALGDPTGILVIDETGFPKQGTHSIGVQRQYSATLGKIANCQLGVFLGYASPQGFAALDRALYLPHSWLDDPARCAQAGIPPKTAFQTKTELARTMVERALDAGVPTARVVGDEVSGSDGALRRALEARGQAYVLAVRSNEQPSR